MHFCVAVDFRVMTSITKTLEMSHDARLPQLEDGWINI